MDGEGYPRSSVTKCGVSLVGGRCVAWIAYVPSNCLLHCAASVPGRDTYMITPSITRGLVAAVGTSALILGTVGAAGVAGAITPRTTGDDITPTRVINGTNANGTDVSYRDITVDSAGNVYAIRVTVANEVGAYAVVKFPKNFVSGTPQPVAVLPAPTSVTTPINYGLNRLQVTSDGRLLVSSPIGSIFEYPANWTASSTPTRTLSGLSAGQGTFVEAPDGQLYVTNTVVASGYHHSIRAYASNWTAESSPTRTITGLEGGNPPVLAVTPSGKVLAGTDVNFDEQLLTFAADADGDAVPLDSLTGFAANDIAVSSDGSVYVATKGGGPIEVYADDATGNSAPIRTIGPSMSMEWVALGGEGLVYGAGRNISEFGGKVTPPPDNKRVPSAPRNLKAVPGVRSLIVSLRESSRPGTSPIGRYIVTARSDESRGDETTCTIVLPATQLTCTLKGLAPEVMYQVTAVAKNAVGPSPTSAIVRAETLGDLPNDPLAISRVNPFNGGARVFFTAPSKSKKRAVAYVVKMYSTGWRGDRPGCKRFMVPADRDKMWCDVTGIQGGTIVWFTVTPAYPKTGAGPESPESRPLMIYSAPGPVTNAVFVLAGGGRIRIVPAAPKEDGAKPITGYRVVVQDTGEACTVELRNTTECTISGLEPRKNIFVVIYAINEMGEGPASNAFKVRPR